jgi:hypothetical protein
MVYTYAENSSLRIRRVLHDDLFNKYINCTIYNGPTNALVDHLMIETRSDFKCFSV